MSAVATALAVVLAAAVGGGAAAASGAEAEGGGGAGDAHRPGDRSAEIVHLGCASDVGRREVTLFGNGTVRVRRRQAGEERMALGELTADEVAGVVAELRTVDLAETDAESSGPVGGTVETCQLVLALPGSRRQERSFSRLESLSLALGRALAIVEGLAERAGSLRGEERLPRGYSPRPGDVLKRADGELFEVVAFTLDGRGVELQGLGQPLTVYVDKENLDREFVAVVTEARR